MIENFLNEFNKTETLRLFMPGHKGNPPEDITEISGADSLYEASGIIAESEKRASRLFGSRATLFSTQGSTLSIQTMLALAKAHGAK